MVAQEIQSELETRESEGSLIVRGDIDLYEAPHFRAIAESYISRTESPRFDMTDVPFVDSAGLATLLYLARQARTTGKEIRIQIAGGPRRVLHVTGIDQMIVVED